MHVLMHTFDGQQYFRRIPMNISQDIAGPLFIVSGLAPVILAMGMEISHESHAIVQGYNYRKVSKGRLQASLDNLSYSTN